MSDKTYWRLAELALIAFALGVAAGMALGSVSIVLASITGVLAIVGAWLASRRSQRPAGAGDAGDTLVLAPTLTECAECGKALRIEACACDKSNVVNPDGTR